MWSCPVCGLMPPLSSQLKLKPKDAGPVNPAPDGSCPPPRPVHAVSTTARMQAAASKIDRWKKRGPPIFLVPLQKA